MFDIDKNGEISKEEFITIMQKWYKKFEIDPLKDFSLSLLSQIKNLYVVKEANLLDSFVQLDPEKKGYTDFQGVISALEHFGL